MGWVKNGEDRNETLFNVLVYVVFLAGVVALAIYTREPDTQPPDTQPQHHCRYDPRYGDDC